MDINKTLLKGSDIFSIKETWNPEEAAKLPARTLAYIGDAVYELYIRTELVNNSKMNPHKLHVEAIKYVKAGAQAELLSKIYDSLTEEEQDIVRRTRNTRKPSFAKKF